MTAPDCSCFYHAPELHGNGGCGMVGCTCQWDGVLRTAAPVMASYAYRGSAAGFKAASAGLDAIYGFPGGPVAIPKPTRADLLLSCRQWSDAVRDAIVDCEEDGRVLAKLERLNAVLAELKEMG